MKLSEKSSIVAYHDRSVHKFTKSRIISSPKMILSLGKTVTRQKLVRLPNFSLSVDEIVMGRKKERVDRCGDMDAFVKDHSTGDQFCVLEWNVHARGHFSDSFSIPCISLYLCWNAPQETRARIFGKINHYCSLVSFRTGYVSQHSQHS